MWHVNFFKCVSLIQQITQLPHATNLMRLLHAAGERDWLDRIQIQLGAPCPRQEVTPLSTASLQVPHLCGTRTQGDKLQGACLCPGTQCRRPELGASTQACNPKLNKLLGCFLLVKH